MIFNKIFKPIFLLMLLLICYDLYAKENVFLVDRMSIGNSINGTSDNPRLPSSSLELFDDNDKAIFYYARIIILNPSDKKYNIRINCIDKKGDVFFDKKIEENYRVSNYQKKNPYLSGNIVASFALNPKPSAMVANQLKPLIADKEYFIKLYIGGELIGVTQFYYSSRNSK